MIYLLIFFKNGDYPVFMTLNARHVTLSMMENYVKYSPHVDCVEIMEYKPWEK